MSLPTDIFKLSMGTGWSACFWKKILLLKTQIYRRTHTQVSKQNSAQRCWELTWGKCLGCVVCLMHGGKQKPTELSLTQLTSMSVGLWNYWDKVNISTTRNTSEDFHLGLVTMEKHPNYPSLLHSDFPLN